MSRTQHKAFKVEYEGRASRLLSPVLIGIGAVMNKDNQINFKQLIKTTALWDTGAMGTMISKNLAASLKLIPDDITNIGGVHGAKPTNLYTTSIILPMGSGMQDSVVFPNVSTAEGELAGFDVLIGMNIINEGDFAISNANGKTRFSYCIPPHKNAICLYEKTEKVNKSRR